MLHPVDVINCLGQPQESYKREASRVLLTNLRLPHSSVEDIYFIQGSHLFINTVLSMAIELRRSFKKQISLSSSVHDQQALTEVPELTPLAIELNGFLVSVGVSIYYICTTRLGNFSV